MNLKINLKNISFNFFVLFSLLCVYFTDVHFDMRKNLSKFIMDN